MFFDEFSYQRDVAVSELSMGRNAQEGRGVGRVYANELVEKTSLPYASSVQLKDYVQAALL